MSETAVMNPSLKQLLDRMVAARQLSSVDSASLLSAKAAIKSEEEVLRWLAAEYGLTYTTLEDVEPDRQLLCFVSRPHFAEERITPA